VVINFIHPSHVFELEACKNCASKYGSIKLCLVKMVSKEMCICEYGCCQINFREIGIHETG